MFGFILVLLSAGVFALTVANEVLHLAYQSVQGHGVVYSGARAWECAWVNYASLYSARDIRDTVSQLFIVVQVLALLGLRLRKRRQRSSEEE